MEIRLPKEYLIREDNGYMPIYILKPPKDVEELIGYVLKMPQKNVEILTDSIVLCNGNEWNKNLREYRFMFEKEVKIKGRPSKRYRYTEREAYMLYKHIDERKIKARAETVQKGSGKLIRASFSSYDNHAIDKVTEWLIAPDSNDKWAYEFYYDPLKNTGRHKRSAKGFSILEEYPLPDIAIIKKSRDKLQSMLHELDNVRDLKLINDNSVYIRGKNGKLAKAANSSESIAFTAYNMLPATVRERRESNNIYSTPEAEKFIDRLIELGSEIEKECTDFLESYRSEQIARLTKEIKDLIGIDIETLI
ncbi:hypothetical protein BXO88_10960 [Oribacterium sp. C9]|uniref:hypothetical protein n=1 Tax=Oribacterium sp. C9 TaxID=1943579 RepID=UPI00098F1D3B|nr:hypothetical protein [Oribacterium sp. C9]OON85768.1 hypothetical protein BXO88_10960 [Oribacterium sp. C9]